MVKFHLQKVLLLFCFFVVVVILLFSTQYNTKEGGFVKGGIVHNSIQHLSNKISNWFHGQVLGLSFEERFCSHVFWNKSSVYPPVLSVAKQLNIKDGASVFISGVHCGEWTLALKGMFPNIKLYGIDKDPESVAYVGALVNGTYKVSQPFELDTSGIMTQFDHAIVDNLLHVYTPELQCKAITQMIPLLKAGGSLYIGKTYEKYSKNTEAEAYLQNNMHVQLLQTCYWSQNCLHKRTDIVEILYSRDIDFKSSTTGEYKKYIMTDQTKPIDLSNNSYSVFIYKHILVSLDKEVKNNILPVSRYTDEHKNKCTHSQIINATKRERLNIDKEGIRKAVKDMKLRGLDMHR